MIKIKSVTAPSNQAEKLTISRLWSRDPNEDDTFIGIIFLECNDGWQAKDTIKGASSRARVPKGPQSADASRSGGHVAVRLARATSVPRAGHMTSCFHATPSTYFGLACLGQARDHGPEEKVNDRGWSWHGVSLANQG